MARPAEWASPKQPHGKTPDLAQRTHFAGRFPKSARLRSRSDFSRAKTSSERVVTRHFVFLLSPRAESSAGGAFRGARLGVTASRKVGTAVVRNRAKRLVREAFRATSATLWPDAVDLIVVVRSLDEDARLHSVIAEWEAARPRFLARTKRLASVTSAQGGVNPTPSPQEKASS